MQNVSSEYKKAISARCRRINHSRVTIGDTVLTGDNIRSISITEAVCDGDVMMPGCACSAQATVKVNYQSGVGYAGQKMIIERGIELEDGSIEYVLLGTFWITDPSSSDDYKTVDIVAQDAMVKMVGTYECTLSFPTTAANMIKNVVTRAGLTLVPGLELPEIIIETKPEGYSYREILGHLAGMCGKYAKATRDGQISIEWYTPSGQTIQTDQIILGGFRRLNDSPIRSRFSAYTDLGETLVQTTIPPGPDEDPGITDTNTDSWLSYLQDPRPITGLYRWAIIDDYMFCFSNDMMMDWNLFGTEIVITASQILWSNNSVGNHSYPDGWNGFRAYDTTLSITVDSISASSFTLKMDDGTLVFEYTPGAYYIGDNYGVPSSGDELNAADRYSWDMKQYLPSCPFDTYDPTDEGAYTDSTLVYHPLNMSSLPKNWVIYHDPTHYISNVSLLDGTANVTSGYLRLVFADEFWFTAGTNDPTSKHITFTLDASFPRYTFSWGKPNNVTSAEKEDYIWRLEQYEATGTNLEGIDNYRLPVYPNEYVKLQSHVRGDNAGFLFYTHLLASSCDIYNTPYIPEGVAVDLGYEYYPSHLIFPTTKEELLHSCGTPVIPDKPSTTDPDGNEIKYDSGATDYTNPLITKEMLNAIQSAMPVTEYMPCNVQWRGSPNYEAGDLVIVVDRYGTKWTVPIMQQTLEFAGGLKATINAPGLTEEAAKFTASSSLDRSVRRVRADLKRQKATS